MRASPVRRAAAALTALGCCSAAGCGGDRVAETTATPTFSAGTAVPTGTATPPAAPSALPTTLESDVDPKSLGGRVTGRLTIRSGPDWLAAGAGSVWVKTDTGSVVRVDPASAREIVTIPVAPDALCQGLGASDQAVWTCGDGGTVARIDPATNQVAAVVEVGKYGDQGQIPVAFGRAWVLTADGSRLTPIGDGDVPGPVIDLGTRCIELTASASAIWAACPIDGVALRIDPTSGSVTARVEGLTSSRAIAASEGKVWVGFVGGVARIDEATATVTAVADADPGLEAGIAATPGAVWARSTGDFLRRIDPATAEVVEDLTAPERSGGEVLVAFGHVWASAYDDDVLLRITPTP